MATNKKPRKKYRPKQVLQNPVGYVLEGFKPLTENAEGLTSLRLKNSSAMAALMRGTATKKDMDTLIAMSNITEALVRMGVGEDCAELTVNGREALLKIIWRAVERLKFIPTGSEIKALNTLMELHDAQMDVITTQELAEAIARAQGHIRNGNYATLPPAINP